MWGYIALCCCIMLRGVVGGEVDITEEEGQQQQWGVEGHSYLLSLSDHQCLFAKAGLTD